jgi:hypothetical protein
MVTSIATSSPNGRAHSGGVTDDDIHPGAKPAQEAASNEYVVECERRSCGSDERGTMLRRRGLYTNHVSESRKPADTGASVGLARTADQRRSRRRPERGLIGYSFVGILSRAGRVGVNNDPARGRR